MVEMTRAHPYPVFFFGAHRRIHIPAALQLVSHVTYSGQLVLNGNDCVTYRLSQWRAFALPSIPATVALHKSGGAIG